MGKHGKHPIYKTVGPWTPKENFGDLFNKPQDNITATPWPIQQFIAEIPEAFGCEKVCWSFLANIEVETSTRNKFDQVSVAISSIVESTKFGKSEQRNKVGPAEHRNRVRDWESRVMRLWTFNIDKLRKSIVLKPLLFYFIVFFCMDQKTCVSTRSASRKRVVDM